MLGLKDEYSRVLVIKECTALWGRRVKHMLIIEYNVHNKRCI